MDTQNNSTASFAAGARSVAKVVSIRVVLPLLGLWLLFLMVNEGDDGREAVEAVGTIGVALGGCIGAFAAASNAFWGRARDFATLIAWAFVAVGGVLVAAATAFAFFLPESAPPTVEGGALIGQRADELLSVLPYANTPCWSVTTSVTWPM